MPKYDDPKPLIENGWKFNRECRCAHDKKYYYRNEKILLYEVVWFVKKYQFKVTKQGMTVVGLKPIGQLEVVLKAL
jgi:hypothetical protein